MRIISGCDDCLFVCLFVVFFLFFFVLVFCFVFCFFVVSVLCCLFVYLLFICFVLFCCLFVCCLFVGFVCCCFCFFICCFCCCLLTPNSRSLFRVGVSLNIHSFIVVVILFCLFVVVFVFCCFICCFYCCCLLLFLKIKLRLNKAHLTDDNSVIITTPVTSIEIPSFGHALTDFTSLKISLCQKGVSLQKYVDSELYGNGTLSCIPDIKHFHSNYTSTTSLTSMHTFISKKLQLLLVRACAYCGMGRRIDPSLWTH